MTKVSKYTFRRLGYPGSAYRLDCVSSTGDSAAFEALRGKAGKNRGRLYVNLNPQGFSKTPGRKKDIRLTALTHSKNITTVYQPNRRQPVAFGDYCGDALIFDTSGFRVDKFGKPKNGCEITMYVVPGERANAYRICASFNTGGITFDDFATSAVHQECIETVTQGELFDGPTTTISNHYEYE